MNVSPEFVRAVRKKYHHMKSRLKTHQSYVRKEIGNDFRDFSEFLTHAVKAGFQPGFHMHRPNRDGNYSPDNLVFLTAEEHFKISGAEKRKLTHDQAREARLLYKTGSTTRAIARIFGVSQALAWQLCTYLIYTDVAD